MVTPTQGPLMDAPELRWGMALLNGNTMFPYVETGPYRQDNISDTITRTNGYTVNGWYRRYEEERMEGGPTTVHHNYNGNIRDFYHLNPGVIATETYSYELKFEQLVFFPTAMWHQHIHENADQGLHFVIDMKTTTYHWGGYNPEDWYADFYEILYDTPNPDKIIGFEVTGTMGTRRYLEYTGCQNAGPEWLDFYEDWSNDTSELGFDAYDAFFYKGGANSYAAVDPIQAEMVVYNHPHGDSSPATIVDAEVLHHAGTYTVYKGLLADMPSSTFNPGDPAVAKMRKVPSATYGTSMGVMPRVVGTNTSLIWTAPFTEVGLYWLRWAPAPPWGYPEGDVNHQGYMGDYTEIKNWILRFKVHSPWQWRYLYGIDTPQLPMPPAPRRLSAGTGPRELYW